MTAAANSAHVLLLQPRRRGRRAQESERRSTVRFRHRSPICFRPVDNPGKPFLTGETVNISAQGVYFVTDSRPLAGALIQLVVAMPQEITGKASTEYCFTGRVVRVQPIRSEDSKWGVAVQFYYHVLHYDKEA
jgi:PilZ domain-containing protein